MANDLKCLELYDAFFCLTMTNVGTRNPTDVFSSFSKLIL